LYWVAWCKEALLGLERDHGREETIVELYKGAEMSV
jgi:hypothetical protein